MQGSTVASIASIVIIGSLIIGGTYYTIQQSQVTITGLDNQIAGLNGQVANLNVQMANLVQRTVQVVTVQNTIVTVETQTLIVTTTSTSSVSVYPVPDNITVAFVQVSGGYNYVITAGASTYTGSYDRPFALQIAPVFQGETISVSASLTGVAGCSIGQTTTAEIFLNGQVVAQGTQICSGINIQISYTA